ncbi:MAG: BMP family protein [Synechococcales cyanobacterium]
MIRFSRRKLLQAGSALTGVSLLLPSWSAKAQAQSQFKLAAVYAGIVTDQSWNQSAHDALNAAQKKMGFEYAFVEKVAPPDQPEALADFARRGYNLVLGHSGQFIGPVKQVAPQFPNTKFLVSNGGTGENNIISVQFNNLHSGFLAGIVAGQMTKSKKLAFITATKFKAADDQLRGFELGAQSIDPGITVTPTYTNDYADVAKAKEAALAQISAGVDVIWHALDNAFVGVIEAATEKKVFVIGNYTDQLSFGPETVLTSSIANIGGAVASVITLAVEGKIEPKDYSIGAEDPSVISLGEFNTLVPEAIKTRSLAIKTELSEDKIRFQTCQVNGQESWCMNG